MKKVTILLVSILISTIGCLAQTKQSQQIKVGAAKLNITPKLEELGANSLGIHDSIYVRAIVIDNGVTKAALVTVSGNQNEQSWKTSTERMEKELGIPAKNVVISSTHSHSVGRIATVEEKIFTAVKMANAKLKPATIGWGKGVSYINVKRDLIDPKTRTWWEGANYDGASDKTVYVISFAALDGTPIAVYYNYAMHAVIMGQYDMVSGDVPDATSGYIEDSYNNKIVAVWSAGASGDQNPIYFQQTFDLRDIRIKEYASRGEDISNAMPSGGTGLNRKDPVVQRLMKEQELVNNAMGVMLGEEVKHVIRGIERPLATADIKAAQEVLKFPGRRRTNQGRGGIAGTYEDGDSVTIRVGVLLLGDIALGTVSGETYNLIARQFIKESPYAKTMMVTIANGSATTGYIPDDASFGANVFEVLSSRLKPGYAERGIIDGILNLIQKVNGTGLQQASK
jgi:neutral ceramidase